MSVRVAIDSITVSDGGTIKLPEQGVVLIVGPNNSGKSQALRDIQSHAAGASVVGIVIKAIRLTKTGDKAALHEHFDRAARIGIDTTGSEKVMTSTGAHAFSSVASWWSIPNQIPVIANHFILHADTETRLSSSLPVAAMDLYSDIPREPIHFLYRHPGREATLSRMSKEAFGFGLMLDRFSGGKQWAIRIGDPPESDSPRPTDEFLSGVQAMPLLHEQGDGVRSMMGLLLAWETGEHMVALVDEPEAFLHPPQAAFLAEELARDATANRRLVIMSTHSSDVVRGALSSEVDVTVLRVSRDGSVNHMAALATDDVKNLWSDSLLRYSNLLEGLFCDGVIVCESDTDCRYYSAVLDAGRDFDSSPGSPRPRRPDLLFTHCGGKHRLHVAIAAMRAARVPVRALADFDVLRERNTLERIVVSLGGKLDDAMIRNLNILHAALGAAAKAPSTAFIQERFEVELAALPPGALQAVDADRLRKLLRTETGWDTAKQTGLQGVPKGDPYTAAVQLLEDLRAIGLHVVPVGEIESFVPEVGLHGPGWLADVLEQGLYRPPASAEALEYVRGAVADL